MSTRPRAGGRRSTGKTQRSLETLSDAELVAKCASGDASAWEALVHRYKSLVYAIPHRMGLGPSDADDVFQVTFTRLAERIGSLADASRVRAWLVTTSRRVALGMIARARVRGGGAELESLSELPDPGDLPSEEIERLQNRDLVRRSLDRLEPRCRELLTKLYYGRNAAADAVSYATVATELGVPVGSVGPTRLRCLQKLLAVFQRLAAEPEGSVAETKPERN
jgi:RNA polymerase sigma factor (sigma-70 family)